MAKHSHRAHCQACGRIQAMTPRGVAKHGYTVKNFGFFNGVCDGSDSKPLELERTITDAIIVRLGIWEKVHTDLAADYASGKRVPEKVATDRVERNPKTKKFETIYVTWEQADQWQRKTAVEHEVYTQERSARYAREHAKMLTELIGRVHGQPMLAVDPTKAAPILVEAGTKFRLNGEEWEIKYMRSSGFSNRITGCMAKREIDEKPRYFSLRTVRECLRS